eukprot:UN31651
MGFSLLHSTVAVAVIYVSIVAVLDWSKYLAYTALFINGYVNVNRNIPMLENIFQGARQLYIDRHPLPSLNGPLEIPMLMPEQLTPENFLRVTNNFDLPLYVPGLYNNTTAVKEWNFEYLKRNLGALEADLSYKGSGFLRNIDREAGTFRNLSTIIDLIESKYYHRASLTFLGNKYKQFFKKDLGSKDNAGGLIGEFFQNQRVLQSQMFILLLFNMHI